MIETVATRVKYVLVEMAAGIHLIPAEKTTVVSSKCNLVIEELMPSKDDLICEVKVLVSVPKLNRKGMNTKTPSILERTIHKPALLPEGDQGIPDEEPDFVSLVPVPSIQALLSQNQFLCHLIVTFVLHGMQCVLNGNKLCVLQRIVFDVMFIVMCVYRYYVP